jgi:cation diffusion facilitator family transporter
LATGNTCGTIIIRNYGGIGVIYYIYIFIYLYFNMKGCLHLINSKTKVAALSVASNTTLIIIKIIAGLLSGSVSIISEAIHSGMDLIASLIAFFAVRFSSKPADKDHPYGHGKMENLSGTIEGLLIFVAAILIINQAIEKIIHQNQIEINMPYAAAGVMIISSIVNTIVSRMLYKVAKKTESIALEADALHLKTDVLTSAGVAVGMIIIAITGIKILDPIVAILVAMLILKEAFTLCRKAALPLLDPKLSDEEEKLISAVMGKYEEKIIDFHSLRTRMSGNVKYIDFHMTVIKELTVEHSHLLCEAIEDDLENILRRTNVSIHIEPGDARDGTHLENGC